MSSGKVPLKHGYKYKVRLSREDAETPTRSATPAVTVHTRDVAENQCRPVVAQALLAAWGLKKTLVTVHGSKALSLGTVAAERV